jgi:hypothetical protein
MMTGRERVEHLLQALQWWTGGMQQQYYVFISEIFPGLQAVVEVIGYLLPG